MPFDTMSWNFSAGRECTVAMCEKYEKCFWSTAFVAGVVSLFTSSYPTTIWTSATMVTSVGMLFAECHYWWPICLCLSLNFWISATWIAWTVSWESGIALAAVAVTMRGSMWLFPRSEETKKLLTKACKEVSYNLKDTQKAYGKNVKVPLPLVDGNYDPDLSYITFGDAAKRVAEKMNLIYATSVHKSVITVVQVSGGGKTKLALDLCLKRFFWPLYVPFRSQTGGGRQFAAIRSLKEQLEKEPPNTNLPYNDARKQDKKRLSYVMAFIAAHVQVVDDLHYFLHEDENFKDLDDDLKLLLFVRVQVGMAFDFSGVAQKVLKLLFLSENVWSTSEAIIKQAKDRIKGERNLCIVYDEVTRITGDGALKGYFLHKERTKNPIPDEQYLTTQANELNNITATPDHPFEFPTNLLYALRRIMNDLNDLKIPQLMMDTRFSIAEEVFINEGSETRMFIEKVGNMPFVSSENISEWFQAVFGEVDEPDKRKMKQFCGRPRVFYDSYLWRSFLPKLKDASKGSVATSIKNIAEESIADGTENARNWMKTVINEKGNPKVGTHRKILLDIFIHAWRYGGKFKLETQDLETLVSEGIIFGHETTSNSKQKADFKTEPLLWSTIIEYYRDISDYVLDGILGRAYQTNDPATFGKKMEEAIAWKLFTSNGNPFASVFPTTYPQAPTWVQEGNIYVSDVCSSPIQQDFCDFLHGKPQTLMFPQEACGPDIVFSIKDKDGIPVRVYLQVKHQKSKLNFPEAVYSTQPYLFYQTKRKEKAKDLAGVNPCEPLVNAFSKDTGLDARYVQLIVSFLITGGVIKFMTSDTSSPKWDFLKHKPVLVARTTETTLGESSKVLKKYVTDGIKEDQRHVKIIRSPDCVFEFPSLIAPNGGSVVGQVSDSVSDASANNVSAPQQTISPKTKKKPAAFKAKDNSNHEKRKNSRKNNTTEYKKSKIQSPGYARAATHQIAKPVTTTGPIDRWLDRNKGTTSNK
eukprot:m.1179492 g.1179492  ORF g.1179492 m.1179492 type:complete len:979 (-) comp24529_c0_seq45:2120-5056(-)